MTAQGDEPSLAQLAREAGWRAAIEQRFPDAYFRAYVTDSSRASFLDLLPIEGSDVLEIGPGLGQFTPLIAAKAATLAVLEVDPEQADFVAERVRQEGYDKIVVETGGGDCTLPYESGSFDLVILNLVFEWCAIRLEEDHHAAQQRLLRELHRTLRPGGRVYLATKNRFAVKYLLGRPDEHFSGMPFGSALPRWLAKRLHRRRQAGMLYSYGGLKRLLERTGFDVEQTWWATPEMRFPSRLIPTDPGQIRKARREGIRQGSSRSESLLTPLIPAPLLKYFTPGLAFLSRRR